MLKYNHTVPQILGPVATVVFSMYCGSLISNAIRTQEIYYTSTLLSSGLPVS